MGNACSKKEKRTQEEIDAELVFDRELIYWDADGNIRLAANPLLPDASQELKEIVQLEAKGIPEGEPAYIVDSSWLTIWLAYVRLDVGNAPKPGPCRNDRLLTWDHDAKEYVARSGLMGASHERTGDFRRISQETWEKFIEFYPGSGPTITTIVTQKELDTGKLNLASWKVVDPPPPPVDPKKRKKKLFLRNKKKEEAEDEEKEGEERDREIMRRMDEEKEDADGAADGHGAGGKVRGTSIEVDSHSGLLADSDDDDDLNGVSASAGVFGGSIGSSTAAAGGTAGTGVGEVGKPNYSRLPTSTTTAAAAQQQQEEGARRTNPTGGKISAVSAAAAKSGKVYEDAFFQKD